VVNCTPPDPQSEEPGRGFKTLAHVNVGKDVLSVSVVVTSDDGRLEKSSSTWTERVAAIMHTVGLPKERTIELMFYKLCGAINVFELIALSLRSKSSPGSASSTPLLIKSPSPTRSSLIASSRSVQPAQHTHPSRSCSTAPNPPVARNAEPNSGRQRRRFPCACITSVSHAEAITDAGLSAVPIASRTVPPGIPTLRRPTCPRRPIPLSILRTLPTPSPPAFRATSTASGRTVHNCSVIRATAAPCTPSTVVHPINPTVGLM